MKEVKLEERILEVLKKNYYPLGEMDDDETRANEIAHLIENDYYEKDFSTWVFNDANFIFDELPYNDMDEVYLHWLKLRTKRDKTNK
jgi:hypothetical protein